MKLVKIVLLLISTGLICSNGEDYLELFIDIAIEFKPEHNNINYAQKVADELDLKLIGCVDGLNFWHFRYILPDGIKMEVEYFQAYLEAQDCLREKTVLIHVGRPVEIVPKKNFNDPLYSEQWALGNHKIDYMNIQRAWKRGYDGQNVTICIVDGGMDHRHPDLRARYRPDLSFDFNDFGDPLSAHKTEGHGTHCAGIAAAEANNGVCGVGVAYAAYISAFRLLEGPLNSFLITRAITFLSPKIDIKVFSWGPDDDGKRVEKPDNTNIKAFEYAARRGRNGLGTLLIWAAGNGGIVDHGGADGFSTNPHVIAFTAVNQHGRHEEFAEKNPGVFAATYAGQGISKTNNYRTGLCTISAGGGCKLNFCGTSAATPLAAGILALVLQANPKLTYRDVMHIIAKTAIKPPKPDKYWIINGAGYFLHDYIGFGTLDAMGMIDLALKWKPVSKRIKCDKFKIESVKTSYPASDLVYVEFILTVKTSEIKRIEHVETTMTIETAFRGGTKIVLISPSGTSTVLLDFRPLDTTQTGFEKQPFSTNRYWGEAPNGKWTLGVTMAVGLYSMISQPQANLDQFTIYGNN